MARRIAQFGKKFTEASGKRLLAGKAEEVASSKKITAIEGEGRRLTEAELYEGKGRQSGKRAASDVASDVASSEDTVDDDTVVAEGAKSHTMKAETWWAELPAGQKKAWYEEAHRTKAETWWAELSAEEKTSWYKEAEKKRADEGIGLRWWFIAYGLIWWLFVKLVDVAEKMEEKRDS